MDVYYIHGLEQLLMFSLIAQGQVKTGVGERHPRAAKDARLIVLVFVIAEGKYIDLMPGAFEGMLVQVNVICHATHVRLVRVHHHSDTHESIVQATGDYCQDANSPLMVESPSEE
jgi:hypothetical protein